MNAPIRRALLSVSDKTGIIDLAKALTRHGVHILSTGGTASHLAKAGIAITEVSDHTGFPEMLDGRVKTLHPKIHGGLLGERDKPEHRQAMSAHGIDPIDLVVINLYPFEATVARGAAFHEIIENIDIGGPSMIRSAAKNHAHVAVATSPDDYAEIIASLDAHQGALPKALLTRLAAAAFARTAAYDSAIGQWFARHLGDPLPARFSLSATRRQTLRYGENPHQKASFYQTDEARPGVASARQLQGKELSYNNIQDTDAAFELVAEFSEPAAAIIKHANPCGVAIGTSLAVAYQKALACDPVSAFGGIIALNRPLDAETAALVAELFAEVIIAPSITPEAKALLAKKTNLRLLVTDAMPNPAEPGLTLKSVAGGLLVQERDHLGIDMAKCKTVTQKSPDKALQDDLLFAFTVCKHVKSNAIVLAKDGATVGIGGGQTSRVDAVRQSIERANRLGDTPRAKGAVLASDAFFPFPDNVELAARAGIAAIIQPGGSVKDADVIKAADALKLPMLFTGQRHFKH